jgi:hypothetical protein
MAVMVVVMVSAITSALTICATWVQLTSWLSILSILPILLLLCGLLLFVSLLLLRLLVVMFQSIRADGSGYASYESSQHPTASFMGQEPARRSTDQSCANTSLAIGTDWTLTGGALVLWTTGAVLTVFAAVLLLVLRGRESSLLLVR